MDAGGAMYVEEDRLTLMTEGGTTPTAQQMRTLSGALAREDYPQALFRAKLFAPVMAGGGERSYLASLTKGVDAGRL